MFAQKYDLFSLDALHKARFVKISPATVQENHPHGVTIAKKAPNY